MKNEKLFEVILAPTDMLEKELENVFGGAYGINGCIKNTANCNINDCNVNSGDCDINNCQGNSKPEQCPPGYTWNGCKCVPVDEF